MVAVLTRTVGIGACIAATPAILCACAAEGTTVENIVRKAVPSPN